MYTKIKKYIETYEGLKDKVLGNLELETYRYELAEYFTPTYLGYKNYVRVMKYLEGQISHRKQQRVDLRYSSSTMRFKWKRLERIENGYKVCFAIDGCIHYRGVDEEAILKNQLRELKVSEIGGKLKIEKDLLYELDDGRTEWVEDSENVVKRENKRGTGGCRKKIERRQTKTREEDIQPRGIYDRQKAVEYAKKYALQPNVQQWKNYEKYGGDCTNFISQSLYAGGIPFDHWGKYVTNKWYWYSDTHRTPSFTSANALKTYMINNEGFGLVTKQVGAKEELDIGDIVQLGDEGQTTHSMIVVGKVYDKENPARLNDLLIAQHSTDKLGRGYNIPLSIKPNNQLYFKILGYNP